MNILNQSSSYKPALELQKFMDTYGIVVEDCQAKKENGSVSAIGYRIKFSVPEFLGNGIITDKNLQETGHLASEFKSKVNSALVEMWNETDAGYDDAWYKECLKCFTYLCRTRKGETWTCENRDKALGKTNSAIKKISNILKQYTEYEEI